MGGVVKISLHPWSFVISFQCFLSALASPFVLGLYFVASTRGGDRCFFFSFSFLSCRRVGLGVLFTSAESRVIVSLLYCLAINFSWKKAVCCCLISSSEQFRVMRSISPFTKPLKTACGCADSRCSYWKVSVGFLYILTSKCLDSSNFVPL